MPAITTSEQLVNLSFYIFNGTATNADGETVVNIVVQCLSGALHVVRYRGELKVLSFNTETEGFDLVSVTSTGFKANLQAQAPFLPWGNVANITVLPTKETTLGKIIPTEEVSGLNNLNVIEDELTDI